MTLLWELGLAERIPQATVDALIEAMRANLLDFFPLSDAEIPAGKNESQHVVCHCGLGTIDQVLLARGVDLRRRLPWTAGWYRRYQLPDGGLNCEKRAYTSSRKSSFLSTLPCLEAVLARAPEIPREETEFLERGAGYLIAHRLVRSTKGSLVNPDWLKPCFPRFYEYDVLRGARFLLDWSRKTGGRVPAEALADAKPWLDGKRAVVERDALDKRSLVWSGTGWEKNGSSRFSLLKAVCRVGAPIAPRAWPGSRTSRRRS